MALDQTQGTSTGKASDGSQIAPESGCTEGAGVSQVGDEVRPV
ncbi:hypothetical protein [Nocardia sp.]|nr:hypothetical protein [Nocardia sp.]